MASQVHTLPHLQRQLARARERSRSERGQRDEWRARCEQLEQANAALRGERDAMAAALWQLQTSRGWRTFQRMKQTARRYLRPLLWCRNWWRRRTPVTDATTPPTVPFTPTSQPPLLVPDLAGGPRVPSRSRFRVLFVVRSGHDDSASIRYRGYNLIEALRLRGLEADPLDDRHLGQRLNEALTYDLIVLVRRQWGPEMLQLLEAATRAGVPVACDMDDLLFDERAIPHVGFLRSCSAERAREWVRHWRQLPERCPYFIGSTPHLQEQVAALGKPSYLIPNGVNLAQLELSRQALTEAQRERTGEQVRLGYFSGTPTHQSDFRLVAATLVRLMEEFPMVRLIVTGAFDLTEFPEFAPFGGRVESRPWVAWTLLPAEIARADVNLIPLEINYFTEGKSDLKYYEAALVNVPSVASPTQVYVRSIEHGVNGFLARTADEWYAALRTLIVDPRLRQQLGEQAHQHALREYVPDVIGAAAVSAYQDILARHRDRLGVVPESPTVVLLVSDLARAVRDRHPALTLAAELVRLGVSVTLHLPPESGFTAAAADQFLAEHYVEPLFAVQVGGEVPCADILLATDSITAHLAKRYEQRARRVAYLVSAYEPFHPAADSQAESAARSYQLGLPLFVFDAVLADLLARHHGARAEVLPSWIELHEPVEVLDPEPKDLLVVAAAGLPERVWHEALAALAQLHHAYPDVRIALCGEAAAHAPQAAFWNHVLPWLDGPEFAALLAARPVCLALYPLGKPPWLYGLLAAGCPVVSVSVHAELPPDCESAEGVMRAPTEVGGIVTALEALLLDRGRRLVLRYAAVHRTRSLPTAGAVAALLLEALALADAPGIGERTLVKDRASCLRFAL